MKVEPRGLAAFLRNPGGCRAVLLHGPDAGLARDHAEALTRTVIGSLDDPFRLVELDHPARLLEEMTARSMTGGRRVIRLRDATDGAYAQVQAALASKGEGLLLLQAGELPSRSKLRSLIEAVPDGAAIACYREDGATLDATIARSLAEAGLSVDRDAAEFLASQLGSDRGTTNRELEKLALYAYPETRIDLAAAAASVGDMAGLELEDALYAMTEGDLAGADRALSLALAEGATAVGVVRAVLLHLNRLERVVELVAQGQSATLAVKSARPPIYFRRQATVVAAARIWTSERLAAACQLAWEAELACKQTGAPAVLLGRTLVAQLARYAMRRKKS